MERPGPFPRRLASLIAAAWDAYAHQRRVCARARQDRALSIRTMTSLRIGSQRVPPSRRRGCGMRIQLLRRAFSLISCSSRSEHTCPSEMFKSFRLVEIAREGLTSAPHGDAAAEPGHGLQLKLCCVVSRFACDALPRPALQLGTHWCGTSPNPPRVSLKSPRRLKEELWLSSSALVRGCIRLLQHLLLMLRGRKALPPAPLASMF